MLYTIPDYYKEFHCIADQCEDTCCAGWQIVIDQKTLRKYAKAKGEIRRKLFKNVDWFHHTFRQDKEKRCAFLNSRDLCDLYLAQGEEGFCKTCREYPRHTEEFEGVREITLSLSCPEVARILMEKKTPVAFLTYERPGEEEFEEFDPFLFSILEDARKEMLGILQNRSLAIAERICLVLGMGHDMQVRMNQRRMFACSEVITKYTGKKALEHVRGYLKNQKGKGMEGSLTMFRQLYQLEFLRKDWEALLLETEDILYGNEESYAGIQDEARKYLKNGIKRVGKKEENSIDTVLEQLLVYFIFTYFPGAVYDGEIYAKVQLAVYCVWMLWELWCGRWLRNGKTVTLEEMTELVYRFSREIEHSEDNIKKLEHFFEQKRFLK